MCVVEIVTFPKPKNWNAPATVYFHYQPSDISVVPVLVSTPSKVESFTDRFYDNDGKLEQNGLWLSKRNGDWRLKFITELDGSCILFSQVLEEAAIIEAELSNFGICLANVLPTSKPILTLSFKTDAGIIDLARFRDDTFYPVMAHRVEFGQPQLDGNQLTMSRTTSKLFALKNMDVLDVSNPSLSTITLGQLPPAALYHVPGFTSDEWNHSILSWFLPSAKVTKLCAHTDARAHFAKLIVPMCVGAVFDPVALFEMDRDAPCVQELKKILAERDSGLLDVETSVNEWVIKLFEGAFEPSVEAVAFSSLPKSMAQVWPKLHRQLRKLIEDHDVLPEEICGALGLLCDDTVEKMLAYRGCNMRIPELEDLKLEDNVRMQFVRAAADKISLLMLGSIKDMTPRGKARRLVNSSPARRHSDVLSVDLTAFYATCSACPYGVDSELTSAVQDQLLAQVLTRGDSGNCDEDGCVRYGPYDIPHELRDLIRQIKELEGFDVYVNVLHIVPWMSPCPIDQKLAFLGLP